MNPPPALAMTEPEQRRLAAARALVQSGAAGVEGLLAMLDDASWAVRRGVVAGLAELGALSVGPLCATLRTRRDSEARISAAVDALVQTEVDVLGELAQLARDSDPALVADAAQILGRRQQARAAPILAALVTHADDNVAVAAVEALGRIGGASAVEALSVAAQSGNFFRVFPAIDVLGRCGDPRAIAPLTELLRQPLYQLEAARALGKTAQAVAVIPLASLFSHPSEGTLRVAALALTELLKRHRESYGSDEAPATVLRNTGLGENAVPRLVRSLARAAPEERQAIAVLLGVIGGEAAASALTSMLEPADAVSVEAAAALERIGRDSDQHVSEALRSGNSSRRRALLPAISRASVASAVALCLGDDDPQVRSLACEALARTGAAAHAPELFPLLSDANVRVAQAAVAAIQALGSAATKLLALQTAGATDPGIRRNGLRILAYFGFEEALPIFIAAIGNADARLEELALSGLAYLDRPQALDAILDAARSPLERTRRGSMRALGQLSRSDERVREALFEGLGDRDAWVRYYSAQAVGKLRLDDATDQVVELLDDEAGQVRVSAVEALSHLGSEVALAALCRVAEAEEPDLKRAALIGLGLSKHPEGYGRLLAAAESEDAATRLVAISALAESGSPARISALERAVRDPDENVRAAALGFASTDAHPDATRLLLDLLSKSDEPSRIMALLARPSDGRVRGLRAKLADADEEQVNLCCSLLARLRTPDALSVLLQTSSDGDLVSRRAALLALASLRTPEALAALRQAAGHDPDARVRQISCILLGQ